MKKALIAVLVLAAAAAVWFLAIHNEQGPESYRFATIEKGAIESIVSSTGTLRATSTVQVGTQVSGRIEAIYVDFNDHVEEGQLIARIDPTLLEQEVRSANASVERSRADLDQATREMDRAERLYQDKVITESEYTTAQYQLTLAKTSYESARINLDKAQRNLNYTEIRAPADGTVLERNVDVGQTVAASLSAPQLFLIAGDLSKMEILALVDESDIGKIQAGQTARFTVQAFTNRTFQGTVQQVRLQSTTQENVVNYLVAVSVDNPDGTLLPGMTATVKFIVERAEDILKVSNAAIRFQPTDAMRAEVRERAGKNTNGTPGDSLATGRSRRGAGAGQGDPANGPATEPGTRSNGRSRRTDRALLWTVDADGRYAVHPVKTGTSDTQFTQIEGPGVIEGLQVIAGVITSVAAGATNPFDSQRGSSGRRRPGF